MKVLQINTIVNATSTGRIAEEIGLTLQNDGHESFIAYRKAGPDGSSSNLVQIGNGLDRYMHGIKTRLLDRHGFGSKRATRKLVEKIECINPDVVGLHNLHGYYLNIEVLFNYLKGVQKPIIWTLHDCWPFTGHCSHFDFVSCDKWKTECHDCPLSDRYPASWLMDHSRENFHRKKELFNGLSNLTIVTPSYWLKRLVAQSFLSDYPIKVINNGINLEKFKPVKTDDFKAKYNLSDKTLLLGVASVWDRIKGLNYFFDLSKRLDNSFRIILVGLPEGKIKKLPENIVGIQRTENIDELVSCYSAADVFVNPALADNFPTTNLEALACGTPVITFNTGGSPEAIDENTGYVIEKGNIDLMYKSISELIDNPSMDYQKKCRERAIKFFNKKDRYQEYLNLYSKISEERKYLSEF